MPPHTDTLHCSAVAPLEAVDQEAGQAEAVNPQAVDKEAGQAEAGQPRAVDQEAVQAEPVQVEPVQAEAEEPQAVHTCLICECVPQVNLRAEKQLLTCDPLEATVES